MKVKILCSINNGRYNIGDQVDFPEEEAKSLIKAGAAKMLVVPKVIKTTKEVFKRTVKAVNKKASPTK